MTAHHETKKKATPGQMVLATVGGLVAPLIAIFLVVELVLSIQAKHVAPGVEDEKAVAERIKPVGSVRIAGEQVAVADAPPAAVANKVERSGEEVFKAVCTNCHSAGVLNAPKFGNKADWAPRIAQGYDTLVKNAISGIRNMPPRGGGALSDLEVERAVAYMTDSAGATFKAPK